MTLRRLAIYLLGLLLLGLVGYGLALSGLLACAPSPLPGDEMWTWRQQAGEALALVLRVGSKACFTGDAAGAAMLWLGSRTFGVLLVVLAVLVLWESVGRGLRRHWFRSRGGHVLLAGTNAEIAGLCRAQGRIGGTIFLAPDRATGIDIARHHPLAEIAIIDRQRLPRQLARFGVARARLLAATTGNDLTNVAMAEAALAAPGSGELLVRMEQFAVRAFSSHRLRLRAAARGRPLAVVSLTQLQTRRGLAAAMPGRYSLDGAPRVHIAICGSGPGLQAVGFEIVRQGYGLEHQAPVLSVLRTGSSDFSAGALHRLETCGAAELHVADVLASADGLDRAIAGAVAEQPPLLAVHCTGDGGEAEALALRWEEVLLTLGQPVPPIVAYGSDPRPIGTTGMIRVVVAGDLAEARDAARLMDQRARAVHRQFLEAQRAARGDGFGSAPAEVDWEALPDSFQNDNRAVADQMDYKLAAARLRTVPGAGPDLAFAADEIERLARVAHARWVASKAIGGWRHGVPRDDRLMLHPDMVGYDALDEPAKQKDRDEVATLPALVRLAGEAIGRERRIVVPQPLDDAAVAALCRDFADRPKAVAPVAVIPLDDAGMVRLAATLQSAGLPVEAVLDGATGALRHDEAVAPVLAGVLRAAWRIHVLREGAARQVLNEQAAERVDDSGTLETPERDARALHA